jgi:hypothetical protein
MADEATGRSRGPNAGRAEGTPGTPGPAPDLDGHDAFRARVAAYALEAVDGTERAILAAHLRSCAECRADHDRYRPVALALAGPHDRVWDLVAGTVAARRRDLDGFLSDLAAMGPPATPLLRIVVASDGGTVDLARRMDEDRRFTVVGQAAEAGAAVSVTAEQRPDLLVVALSQPGREWAETVAGAVALSPATKVVLVSGIEADSVARMVIAAPPAPSVRVAPAPPVATPAMRRCGHRSIIDEAMWQMGIGPRQTR